MNPDEFVEKAVDLLRKRMGDGVVILIQGEEGMEILANSSNPVFQVGMLKVATWTVENQFKSASTISSKTVFEMINQGLDPSKVC